MNHDGLSVMVPGCRPVRCKQRHGGSLPPLPRPLRETSCADPGAHDPLVKLQSSHSEAPEPRTPPTDPRHAVITQRRDGESNTHTHVSGVTARCYYDYRGTSKKTASGAAQLATCQGFGQVFSTSSLKPPPRYICSPRGPLLAPVEGRATAQGVVLIGEQLNRQPDS
ncbi:hypothetical protein EYF80_044951 [Liparis tanakae]|uniref:Uncharacterized protein n=1 Tax=Liparis tanakae TaxID=230148 RepID=A0A4Z2FX08_9TELE|nr:hypothetical protein EYF80_044951 [Liparis tanakae]